MAPKKKIVPVQLTVIDRARMRRAADDVARALDALAASGPTMSDGAAARLAAEAKTRVRDRKK
jgi:hypothetical protein